MAKVPKKTMKVDVNGSLQGVFKQNINRQLSYLSVTEFVKELGLIVTAWHRKSHIEAGQTL